MEFCARNVADELSLRRNLSMLRQESVHVAQSRDTGKRGKGQRGFVPGLTERVSLASWLPVVVKKKNSRIAVAKGRVDGQRG